MRGEGEVRSVLVVFLLGAALAGAEQPAAGTVTLPLSDYDALVARAARPQKRPEAPPVAAVLARAEARVSVAAGVARGTFRLEGEVFVAETVRLPLFAADTLLLDARTSVGRVPLVVDGGALAAVLSGPGTFSLSADFAVPVESEPGRASFTLPVPRAGSVRAIVELPGEPLGLGLVGGSVTHTRTRDGRRVLEATLDRERVARVFWSARDATPAAQREARVLSDVKTLVTLGEAELLAAALLDVTVVEGAPRSFVVELPAGFEVTGATGSTLDTSADEPGMLTLNVREPEQRRHQFLVSLARPTEGGSYRAEAPIVTLRGAQRETGEVGVEGIGTVDLDVQERGTLRRMDTSEAGPALRGLAREALLAAFRYHRRAGEGPALALDVKRFEAAPVLAALAERAVATTLVTNEGRALTEMRLTLRNHAQPFLKVVLPEGATLLSADVGGEGVKPAQGDGGTRVPLLRAGFRPSGPYETSFVYLLPGTPLGTSGQARITLPRVDVPITLLQWEIFLPDRYKVRRFEGNALPADEVVGGIEYGVESGVLGGVAGGLIGGSASADDGRALVTVGGGIVGRVVDESGVPVPGASVTVVGPDGGQRATVTDATGRYALRGLPAGRYRVSFQLSGFTGNERQVDLLSAGGARVDSVMTIGSLEETLMVTGNAPSVSKQASASADRDGGKRKRPEPTAAPPSSNVQNLQRRVSGVLPVRIDVPRTGAAFSFVRPLVWDEETGVSFSYKAR